MNLSYEMSRRLDGKFCVGHNLGVSASMSNGKVLIKTCCAFFNDEIEADLIKIYGADFISANVKFSIAGSPKYTAATTGGDSE